MREKLLLISLSCLFILSCNGIQDSSVLLPEKNTIKYKTQTRSNSLLWADEDKVLVDNFVSVASEGISTTETIENRISEILFYDEIENISFKEANPIYPQLDNFGSLDLSLMPKELFSLIDEFIDCIKKDNFSSAQFVSKKKYLKSFMEWKFAGFNVVSKTMYGAPQFIDDFIEVPVLITHSSIRYVLFFYFTKEDSQWKIDQVQLTPYEKKEGRI